MNIIKYRAILAVTLLVLFSLSARADEIPSFPYLVVTGNAKSEVTPDKATLTLTVSAFDPDSAVAVATVQRQLVALLGTLAEYSIADDAITSYNLVKEIERERKDRIEMEIVGYYISRRVKIDMDDISEFAELVASIAKLDNISSINAEFDVHDRDARERELMNEASADARRTAENMLVGTSRKLGAVYGISERSFRNSTGAFSLAADLGYPVAMAAFDGAGYAETVFEPSTIELRQTVNMMFQIE